jgi:hypothetical protein
MRQLKITLILFLLATPFISNAQFKFGVGGGVNLANLSGSDVSSGTESITGFNGGLMVEVKLPVKLGIEADLFLSTKGSSFSLPTGKEDFKLVYSDLPVVMKIYMVKVLSVQIGAQYSMLVSGKWSGQNIREDLNLNDMSALFGVGIDVLKLHLSARYNYGLTNIYKNGGNFKNNMFTLSVGLWIK